MIFKAPPQLGQCSTSMSKTRLSSRAQLIFSPSHMSRPIAPPYQATAKQQISCLTPSHDRGSAWQTGPQR